MTLSRWLVLLTQRLPRPHRTSLGRVRRRVRTDLAPALERLEDRRLLSGVTIALSTADTATNATTIDEGEFLTLTASWDSGPGGQYIVDVLWGDGGSEAGGPLSATQTSFTRPYRVAGSHTIAVTVSDVAVDDNGNILTETARPSVTATVLVNNVAPIKAEILTGDGANPDEIATSEGQLVELLGSVDVHTFFGHPIDVKHFFLWQVVPESGPPTEVTGEITDLDQLPVPFSFVPSDDGTYTVTFTVTDDDGASVSDAVGVTVANLAPTAVTAAEAIDGYVIAVGEEQPFEGTFLDVPADTHTAAWTFTRAGSTAIETMAATVTQSGTGGGSVSDLRSFTSAGVYTATLTVTDDEFGSTTSAERQFVVYDPSAGFVSGSGRILSPSGAWSADTSVSGSAKFTFNSKYDGNATLKGHVDFRFDEPGFRLRSSELDWLVVTGAQAQLRGRGTADGQVLEFLLTVVDGQVSGGGGTDTLRMKIWIPDSPTSETGAIVYHSEPGADDAAAPTTPLTQGHVRLHQSGDSSLTAGGTDSHGQHSSFAVLSLRGLDESRSFARRSLAGAARPDSLLSESSVLRVSTPLADDSLADDEERSIRLAGHRRRQRSAEASERDAAMLDAAFRQAFIAWDEAGGERANGAGL
ncbi:MAG: PKD domain-containing protein [Planctomycetes bacterium]|nr:PKD domain-containing protein [Planctomycetota bacterium]